MLKAKHIAVIMLVLSLSIMPIATALAVNATGETLTLSVGGVNPYTGGSRETYTMSGYFKNSIGQPLPNIRIDIWMRYPEQQVGVLVSTVYTNAQGYFSYTTDSLRTVYFRAVSPTVSSNLLTVNIVSVDMTYTICPPQTCGPLKWLTFAGFLKDANGNGVPNKEIKIYEQTYPQPIGYYMDSAYTDASGHYQYSMYLESFYPVNFRGIYSMTNGHTAYGPLITVPPTWPE